MKYANKIILFLSIAIFIISIYYIYSREKQMTFEKIATAFDAAILSDLGSRSKEGMPFFSRRYGEGPSDPLYYIEKRKDTTIIHKKSASHSSLSDMEKENLVAQTYLLMEHPVRVSVLDSIFRVELEKQGIVAPTTVSFSNNSTGETLLYKGRESETDIFKNIAAYTMVEQTTGLEGEITLRGFVRVTPAMILRDSLWLFILLLTGELTVFGLLGYVVIRQRKRIPDESEPCAAKPSEEPFQLDTIRKAFVCRDYDIVLSEDSFRLFEYVWKSDSHYASYEDISDYLYGNVDIKTGKNRISQTVKKIRTRLKCQQIVEIKNMSGKGYRIALK